MLKFDFSLLFLFFLAVCWQFSFTLTTTITYCPHKASGGDLVQIWTPNQQLHNHTL
jgi:hypothetical protein